MVALSGFTASATVALDSAPIGAIEVRSSPLFASQESAWTREFAINVHGVGGSSPSEGTLVRIGGAADGGYS